MWPKKPTQWIENRVLKISIPFTWNLPQVKNKIMQRTFWWDYVEVGGPAVELMPGCFDDLDFVVERKDCPGILQKINPSATRTTIGCMRRCSFCGIGIGKIEGQFKELDDWPDLPVLCDNNLLAASRPHFDKVIERLKIHGVCDFNQGLDFRLLTDCHAKRMAEIKNPCVRLALDHMDLRRQWREAFERLRDAGIAKWKISSYCLIGYNSSPDEAWARCEWIESFGIKAYPMWFHPLDTLQFNGITSQQSKLGWTNRERKHIMGYFYQHRLGKRTSYEKKGTVSLILLQVT